jgi:hypothetical protein
MFQLKLVYYLTFSQEFPPQPLETAWRQDFTLNASRSSDGADTDRPSLQERDMSRPSKHSAFLPEDDALLIRLKEKERLPWVRIAEHFQKRSKGTLQVHYCAKLKRRSETSNKTKKRQRSR